MISMVFVLAKELRGDVFTKLHIKNWEQGKKMVWLLKTGNNVPNLPRM